MSSRPSMHDFQPCWLRKCNVKGKHWHCASYIGHSNCVAMMRTMTWANGYEGAVVNVNQV